MPTVLSAPVEALPLVGLPAPVEKPLPVQDVALLALHESVEELPCVTVGGVAVNVIVGGAGHTQTEVPMVSLGFSAENGGLGGLQYPPCPFVQVAPSSAGLLQALRTQLSFGFQSWHVGHAGGLPGSCRTQPQNELGGELTVTVTIELAEPPAPVQVTWKLLEPRVLSGPTGAFPLGGLPAPVEKPLPVQDVALVELQKSVVVWPCVTVDGEAVRLAVGAGGHGGQGNGPQNACACWGTTDVAPATKITSRRALR